LANRRNAIKKIGSDKKKEQRNRSLRSELKTVSRKFATFCSEKKYDQAKAQCQVLFSKFDKAVKKGIVKENTANRKKSRFTLRLNLIKA